MNMRTDAKRRRQFSSAAAWQEPDIPAYEMQKGVRTIIQGSDRLSSKTSADLPDQPRVLGNHAMSELWREYYGPRLLAAKQRDFGQWPAFFPGRIIPGRGANSNTLVAGTLAFERFLHLLSLGGGVPSIGPISVNNDAQYRYTVANVDQIDDWQWRYVEQPRLRAIHPAHTDNTATEEDIGNLKRWIDEQILRHITKGYIPEAMSLIRRCWSPNTREPLWEPETISAARQLFRWALRDNDHPLTCAFEIEFVLSHIQHSWPLNISGYGEYNDVWLEVGRLPMTKIRCTELAVTARVLHELINVRTKGFAPIIVNEYGCDTDGTHRLVGSWLWNLLQNLDGIAIDIASDDVQRRVGAYIAYHRAEMGEIIVRETLRALAEIVISEDLRRKLDQDVRPHVGQYRKITHLPVLLLPEYSCGAVIKGPYDEGVASYRVDPVVYEQMAQDSSLTLPARGPYHLTDRAPLPWFRILEDR